MVVFLGVNHTTNEKWIAYLSQKNLLHILQRSLKIKTSMAYLSQNIFFNHKNINCIQTC